MREFRDKEIQKELQSIASNDKQGIEKIINGSYGWQAENGEEQSSYTRFSKCLVTTAQERLNNLKGINNSNGIQATSIEQTRLSTQAHKDAFNQERQNSDSESAGDSNAKFISVPKVTQCMKLVDVRPMDTKDGYNKVDGRWYYWYAIKNTCKQPIHAYWCDNEGEMAHSSECTRPDKSWEIKSGAKEQSWTRTNHSIGHRKLYIHAANACPVTYKGKDVLFDYNESRGCWVPDH